MIIGPGIALLVGAIAGPTTGWRHKAHGEPVNAPRGTPDGVA
jgi:hypothetical protein